MCLGVVYMIVYSFTDLDTQGTLLIWTLVPFGSPLFFNNFLLFYFLFSLPKTLFIWKLELLTDSQISFIYLKFSYFLIKFYGTDISITSF
jgi:hypothetical protein